MDDQQKLLQNNEDIKKLTAGPVFESGPGWGTRTKSWFGRNFTKVILPAIVLFLITYGFWTKNQNNIPEPSASPKLSVNSDSMVSQIVQRGDSPTLVARRALSGYLQELPNEKLTRGQKVFIEDALQKTIKSGIFKIGERIEFKIDTINSLIEQSKNLTKYQLNQWENYARKIKL